MVERTSDSDMEADKWLHATRRNLLIASITLFALNIGQANIVNMNGLLFDVSFGAPQNLLWLLAASIVFLLVRYHSHSHPYHRRGLDSWTSKLLNNGFIIHYEYAPPDIGGLMTRMGEEAFRWTELIQSNQYDVKRGIDVRFYINARLWCEIENQEHIDYEGLAPRRFNVSILTLLRFSVRDYLKLLRLMLKYSIIEKINYPPTLYLFTPYAVGVLALLSLLCRTWP